MMGNNIIADNLKVLVFKSNIDTPAKVNHIQGTLLDDDYIYQVDVDLEDCDNVLRVECHPRSSAQRMIEQLHKAGFTGARLM
ncbi:hypothetical protein [Fodinibius salsisoli]|uniref:Copper chaperone CopZ n=1 Tax=Fodinibius salsisoli TaxID=2820877 RepID=A0ABT3PHW2_9BACT|nr:hypothetical protein [Fodinibius salsisoli]MCW9705514.1 hypothetical protein [Fodinibius salsisoli]